MEENTSQPLCASEIANLWTQYMNDSMAACFLSHILEYMKDQEYRRILEFASDLSKSHLEKIKAFFQKDQFPTPIGFTEEDVNLGAPPLLSDDLIMVYMYVMTLHGMTGYAGALGNSVREDQRGYFTQCNKESMELFNQISDIMLKRGILSKPPVIYGNKEIDFVNQQNYLNGWIGKKRPLNAVEITGLFFNTKKTIIKIVLELAFAQVTKTKDVQKYFIRGAELCKKHVGVFDSYLLDENLPAPQRWESEVSDSTLAPFSEKFMLYHIVSLVSASLGFYGAGLAVSQRRDLAVQYAMLIAEMGLYAEDGANLLIKYGWMEQPPLAIDRRTLVKKNK
ncbi:hypothetical protein GCM10008967_11280 [Bacillus carboniphilus]|uniref:Transcriptional regulator n=1 Tax=Bacillus carboniphilus TaxID=86663 RepID=A0ABN0W171_9BACI